MFQRVSAEINFNNPDDAGPVIQKLLEIGYNFEVLRWDSYDGVKPDTTITVSSFTELDAFAFFYHVQEIVGPLGGDVIAANHVPLGAAPDSVMGNWRHRRRRKA
jgi:hypothetical protein